MRFINDKKEFGLQRCNAYQIRMGGYKGVLTYDPGLKGSSIVVRPSMCKFESEDRNLSVIRCATFS